MSSHCYEVALFGEFFAQDLRPIVNRITLHSESSQQMHYREFVFEPIDALQQRELGNEPVLLRARKEVMSPDSKWCALLSSHRFHVSEPVDFYRIGFCTRI